ncbi:citrate/2-methylcitrate synthase [Cumulibacter manganitolerans]|uniref:citrate/2-methylcitrate synthase n=1 Tax=Cumulibacter manganitolerans TaxID=1884992 RepID=UPI001294929C|nr:citrate/2-methylcitrate synthase [Cumulibacter manganitolerans]
MSDRYLTTSEAARRLGVKPATLYAYVSRGVLRSVRRPGQLESLYDRAEVDALATTPSSARRESGALLRFRSVVSAVSSQDEQHLYYRGRPIAELCGALPFAEAARLVLEAADVDPAVLSVDADRDLLGQLALNRRLPVALALLGARDPMRADTTPRALVARSLGLIEVAPRLFGDSIDLADDTVQALLVALIDNGLAASTTAARVAASARAGWYDVLSAGLAAMGGRLHGGAALDARLVLREAMTGTPVAEVVARAVEVHGRVPGFGHVVYRAADPRATALIGVLRARGRAAAELRALERLSEAVGAPVNVDGVSAAICQARGLPDRAGEALFQLARTVGITAHAIEEYAEAPLRWRARNDG